MNPSQLRATLLSGLLLLAPACASIPIEGQPTVGCADAPAPGQRSPHADYCQRRYLIVGFFPSIGEAHLNRVSTKAMPLTPLRQLGDYTVVPGIIAYENIKGFGMGTVYGFWKEPSESYSQSPGQCVQAMLGFCKAARSMPRPTPAIPGEDALPGVEPSEAPPGPVGKPEEELQPVRQKRWTP